MLLLAMLQKVCRIADADSCPIVDGLDNVDHRLRIVADDDLGLDPKVEQGNGDEVLEQSCGLFVRDHVRDGVPTILAG